VTRGVNILEGPFARIRIQLEKATRTEVEWELVTYIKGYVGDLVYSAKRKIYYSSSNNDFLEMKTSV